MGCNVWNDTYYFSEDGKVQYILSFLEDEPVVKEGRYKIVYSKNPIPLDIILNDSDSRLRIVRFIGEDRSKMQMRFDPERKMRPINFESNGTPIWLTKKVNK